MKKITIFGCLFVAMIVIVSALPMVISSEASNITIYVDDDGSLSGYVNDSNMNPIEGARVRVYFHGTYKENYTDASGYYNVTDIPVCYCLKNATASKEGYGVEWILLSINEITIHNFVLM